MLTINKFLLSKIASIEKWPWFHPINLARSALESGLVNLIPDLSLFEHVNPIITEEANFAKLLIPDDHPCRSPKDTYYVNKSLLFRTHMTGNEIEVLQSGNDSFLMSGVVFRRDEIDSSHYPIFHQMEGVHRIDDVYHTHCTDNVRLSLVKNADYQNTHELELARSGLHHMMDSVEIAVRSVLGSSFCYRWSSCYFPFTHPSFELEVLYKNNWIEVLGCGLLRSEILKGLNRESEVIWAFGLGIDRLAMLMFDIPDIRLFWDEDDRFLNQFRTFSATNRPKYKPLSRQPSSYRDISFWLLPDFNSNDFFEAIRHVDTGLIESVKEIDSFTAPDSGRKSKTFRLLFQSHSRPLAKKDIDAVFIALKKMCGEAFAAEIKCK